jgi:type IV secretion system protein VirD4
MLSKGGEGERQGVENDFKTHLQVFRDPLVAKNTRGKSDFRIDEIMDDPAPLSLYIVTPGDDGPRMRPIVRLLLSSFLRRATSAPLQFRNGEITDELPDLKRMQPIEEKLPIMLGYGIDALCAMQDREALIREYGAHQSITRNFAVRVVYPPHDHVEAEWISKELGQRTVILPNVMESGRRLGTLNNVTRSLHHAAAPLMTPDQVKGLRRPKKDTTGRIVEPGEVIIFYEGMAIRCEQIIAPHDPEFARRMAIPAPASAVTAP